MKHCENLLLHSGQLQKAWSECDCEGRDIGAMPLGQEMTTGVLSLRLSPRERLQDEELIKLPVTSGSHSGLRSVSRKFHSRSYATKSDQAPVVFKRRAMAHLAVHDSEETPLLFPRHASTRLRVSLITTDVVGQQRVAHDTWHPSDQSDLYSLLRVARDEVIDQEIFSLLIKEAATLLTTTVSVSERLIVIEASQNSELRFELVSPPLVFCQCV